MDIRVVIIWGIVPTNFKPFEQENIDALERRLIDLILFMIRHCFFEVSESKKYRINKNQ
ncbi:MAG: hypothetical protein QF466_03445 [Desulfobacterales bacterium]|jgi:hypothetical protein|nr:hypothetical protein [Desulfobacterales bacterium]MDP6806317.1 hypothetical protein [Desulfobacterales bacterium]